MVNQQVGDKKRVDKRQEFAPGPARSEPAEQRHQGQHQADRQQVKVLQAVDACADTHGVANWTDDVVAAQQTIKVNKCPYECRQLMLSYINQAAQEANFMFPLCFRTASSAYPSLQDTTGLGSMNRAHCLKIPRGAGIAMASSRD